MPLAAISHTQRPGFIGISQVPTAAGSAQAWAYFITSTGQSRGHFTNTSGFSEKRWLQINYGNGYVTVSDRPGFGFVLDREAIERHTVAVPRL